MEVCKICAENSNELRKLNDLSANVCQILVKRSPKLRPILTGHGSICSKCQSDLMGAYNFFVRCEKLLQKPKVKVKKEKRKNDDVRLIFFKHLTENSGSKPNFLKKIKEKKNENTKSKLSKDAIAVKSTTGLKEINVVFDSFEKIDFKTSKKSKLVYSTSEPILSNFKLCSDKKKLSNDKSNRKRLRKVETIDNSKKIKFDDSVCRNKTFKNATPSKKPKKIGGRLMYFCEICLNIVFGKKKILNHKRIHPINLCSECNVFLLTYNAYFKPIVARKLKILRKYRKKKVPCDLCGKKRAKKIDYSNGNHKRQPKVLTLFERKDYERDNYCYSHSDHFENCKDIERFRGNFSYSAYGSKEVRTHFAKVSKCNTCGVHFNAV